MTDDELIELHEKAIRDAMDAANKRDGFASSGSRESIVAGLRLVAEAAWDEGFTRGFYAGQAYPDGTDASEPDIDNPYRNEQEESKK